MLQRAWLFHFWWTQADLNSTHLPSFKIQMRIRQKGHIYIIEVILQVPVIIKCVCNQNQELGRDYRLELSEGRYLQRVNTIKKLCFSFMKFVHYFLKHQHIFMYTYLYIFVFVFVFHSIMTSQDQIIDTQHGVKVFFVMLQKSTFPTIF